MRCQPPRPPRAGSGSSDRLRATSWCRGLGGGHALFQPRDNTTPDLVAHTAEHRQPLVVAAGRAGGIVEAPVQPGGCAGEAWTGLVGAVTDSHNVVPAPREEPVQRLRFLPGNVDARLRHCAHRERMYPARLSARTRDLDAVAGEVAQEALGHLAAGRVVRAQE